MKDWGIRRKVFFISMVPALLVSIFLGGFFIYNQYINLERSLDERGGSLVKQIAPAAEFGVFSGNTQVLKNLTQSAMQQPDVSGINIYDKYGTSINKAGKQTIIINPYEYNGNFEAILNQHEPAGIKAFSAPIYKTEFSADDDEMGFSDENVKMVVTKEIVGWVVLELSKQSTSDKQQEAIRQGLVITIILLALTWQLAKLIGRSVSEPIVDLTDAVEKLGGGQLNTRVDVTSGGELSTLQSGINAMAESLDIAQDYLQEKVYEATKQLRLALGRLEEQNSELEIARKHADEANKAKSQFLANMSHELRTPLNAIIGYSEMMKEEAEEDGMEEIVPDLNRINHAGEHLLTLINAVLDLSKIEAGKMEVYCEEFSIKELADEVANTIRPVIENNHNQLEINIADDVNEMNSDLIKVKQILFNLISNASKFTENGKISLSVSKSNMPGKNGYNFSVKDTGIGMTEQQVSKLFSPFIQADVSTTRKYGGTGLGLTICKQFCELLGGKIEVKSEVNVGTEFIVRLPEVFKATDEPVEPGTGLAKKIRFAEKSKQQTGDADRRKHLSKILVIDDDPAMRNLLRRQLEKEGFEIIEASDGQQGLAMAHEFHPDVITLDVMMPGMDGWSVLKAIKSDDELNHIAVIILSVISDKNIGFTLGAAEYLTKPVDWDALSDAIKKIIRKSSQPARIMVIEDEEPVRDMVSSMLKKEAWHVIEADNGQVALDKLEEDLPDLIILDLMMPVMDGFEFLQKIKQDDRYNNIPIIILTADDINNDEKRYLEDSVTSIIQKSGVHKDQLMTEICDVIKDKA
jgi:signal transduction histidine kinase/DNA-binding response OmpR family regulator